jgi:hypothetical protein
MQAETKQHIYSQIILRRIGHFLQCLHYWQWFILRMVILSDIHVYLNSRLCSTILIDKDPKCWCIKFDLTGDKTLWIAIAQWKAWLLTKQPIIFSGGKICVFWESIIFDTIYLFLSAALLVPELLELKSKILW